VRESPPSRAVRNWECGLRKLRGFLGLRIAAAENFIHLRTALLPSPFLHFTPLWGERAWGEERIN